MKKCCAVLFLSLMMLLLPAGCSGKTAETPSETVSEPDTSTRTQIHAIESDQTVVYRFHLDNRWPSNAELKLTLLDENEDTGAKAQNWGVAFIGIGSGHRFFYEHHTLTGAEPWDTSSSSNINWRLLFPDGLDHVESADMALTISRKGETMRATLDIDGARAWDAQQTIGNLGEETRYIYLSVEYIDLSNITFSVTGAAGWMPSGWLRLAITVAFLIVLFIIHQFAKKIGDDHVFLVDGGLALTTGAWVLTLSLFVTLLLVRSGSPISRNLYVLPLALPGDGTAFWVTAVVLGLIALGLMVFLIGLAISDMENPLKYLFCGLALGVIHAVWYASLVLVFLSLIGQIVELIVSVLFVAVVCLVFYAIVNTPHKTVEVTTRIYDKNTGKTLAEETHIEFVPIDPDEEKK